MNLLIISGRRNEVIEKLVPEITQTVNVGLFDEIPLCIWRELPNLAIHILETVGYTRYVKCSDSIKPVMIVTEQEKTMKEVRFQVESDSNIPINLWKQLSDYSTRILEEAGYTKYDRKTDSIVFLQK